MVMVTVLLVASAMDTIVVLLLMPSTITPLSVLVGTASQAMLIVKINLREMLQLCSNIFPSHSFTYKNYNHKIYNEEDMCFSAGSRTWCVCQL